MDVNFSLPSANVQSNIELKPDSLQTDLLQNTFPEEVVLKGTEGKVGLECPKCLSPKNGWSGEKTKANENDTAGKVEWKPNYEELEHHNAFNKN